jgi:hypothetical protein
MKQLLSIIMEEMNKQNGYVYNFRADPDIASLHTTCMCISYRGGVRKLPEELRTFNSLNLSTEYS